MALLDDLKSGVDDILKTRWDIRNVSRVPDTEDVALAGGGAQFEGTVLYADLMQSSLLVNEFRRNTAAKVVKCFLYCCSRIITYHDGKITSFDGDRIMGIFIGDGKNTSAAKVALKINYAVTSIIRPKVNNYFSSMRKSPYKIDHAVGLDVSNILAVRAGQRGSNDLVWIGRAPNFAATLSEIRQSVHSSYITESVYSLLNDSAKYGGKRNELMWQKIPFTWLGSRWAIYRSRWWWKP